MHWWSSVEMRADCPCARHRRHPAGRRDHFDVRAHGRQEHAPLLPGSGCRPRRGVVRPNLGALALSAKREREQGPPRRQVGCRLHLNRRRCVSWHGVRKVVPRAAMCCIRMKRRCGRRSLWAAYRSLCSGALLRLTVRYIVAPSAIVEEGKSSRRGALHKAEASTTVVYPRCSHTSRPGTLRSRLMLDRASRASLGIRTLLYPALAPCQHMCHSGGVVGTFDEAARLRPI